MKMKKFATALWKRHGLPAALWLTFTAVGAVPAAQPAQPSPDMASPPALDPVELLRHAERVIRPRIGRLGLGRALAQQRLGDGTTEA